MIVGTAGHIDHGKTALVRALTGVDTDRLPEEKARGISIELGYAFAPLADGAILGFVDVPGHEKFVHAMLAGATGIDIALLVVAADDGVMPQTREHLAIVDLLGVRAGVIALTKCDLVDAAQIDAVTRDVRELAAGTALADAPVFAVSARTGAGVAALREHLAAMGDDDYRRAAVDGFRLAVDRAFTLQGIGTVVTGTVHAGCACVGDDVVVLPGARRTRVRSLHAQNRASDQAVAGERCALNLAGIARDDVARGAWIVAPSLAIETGRFDAQVRWLADAPKALFAGTSVHVHLGAAHVPARIVALEDAVAADRAMLCQLILARPLHALHGDRFVIRDASGTRTLGGGRVLEPQAPARYRRTPERLALLTALAADDPALRLAQVLALSPGGVDLVRFAQAHNVIDIDALAAQVPGRRVRSDATDYLVADGHWLALGERLRATLAQFHATHPDELGPEATRLKRIALPRHDDALFRALVADEIAAGRLRRSGPWLHLPGHDNAPSPQDRAILEKVLPKIADGAFDPPWVRDLARDCAEPEALVRAALVRAAKRGEIFQVVRDLFYAHRAVAHLAALANVLHEADGEVRAARFRDATSLGRKRAIQVLEFFDRVGFTRRVRDAHYFRVEALAGLDAAMPADMSAPGRAAGRELRS